MASAEPPDPDLIHRIERAVSRNLADYVAALRRLYPDGRFERIEVGGGIAAFTGIGSPLTTVKGVGPRLTPDDLPDIESFFHGHGASHASIELAPWPDGEMALMLTRRGYRAVGREDVVVATPAVVVGTNAWHPDAMPADAWRALTRHVLELPDAVAAPLVAAAAQLPRSSLDGVRDGRRWIAAAQSVAYDDVAIFANDSTLPDARRKGAQLSLIEHRLAAIARGAVAVAEVEPASGSERNYLRCGFRIAYARGHMVKTIA